MPPYRKRHGFIRQVGYLDGEHQRRRRNRIGFLYPVIEREEGRGTRATNFFMRIVGLNKGRGTNRFVREAEAFVRPDPSYEGELAEKPGYRLLAPRRTVTFAFRIEITS